MHARYDREYPRIFLRRVRPILLVVFSACLYSACSTLIQWIIIFTPHFPSLKLAFTLLDIICRAHAAIVSV